MSSNLCLAVQVDACYAVVRERILSRRKGASEPGQCSFAAGSTRSFLILNPCYQMRLVRAAGVEQQAGARVTEIHWHRVDQLEELAALRHYLMCLKFPC